MIKDLGTHVDNDLVFDYHVSIVVRKSFYIVQLTIKGMPSRYTDVILLFSVLIRPTTEYNAPFGRHLIRDMLHSLTQSLMLVFGLLQTSDRRSIPGVQIIL